MNIKPLSVEARARLGCIKENGTDHFFNLHEDIAEILNHVASLPPMYQLRNENSKEPWGDVVTDRGDAISECQHSREPLEIIHLNTGDVVTPEGE